MSLAQAGLNSRLLSGRTLVGGSHYDIQAVRELAMSTQARSYSPEEAVPMMTYERNKARKILSRLVGEGMELIEESDLEWDDLVDDEAFWYDFEFDDLPEEVTCL